MFGKKNHPATECHCNRNHELEIALEFAHKIVVALEQQIGELHWQNRELHDRLLAYSRVDGAQTAGLLAQVRSLDHASQNPPVVPQPSPEPQPDLAGQEIPGTQVGEHTELGQV